MSSTLSLSSFQKTLPLFSSNSDEASLKKKKKMEDVMPIATGHEREELEADIEGRKRFDMDAPVGPFGTKEASAIIQSYYGNLLVGYPGGEGGSLDRSYDKFYNLLRLEVIGDGGSPDGHGHDHHY